MQQKQQDKEAKIESEQTGKQTPKKDKHICTDDESEVSCNSYPLFDNRTDLGDS